MSTVDGFTYDRALIESWLLLHDTSPCSGAVLSSKALVPNSVLKAAIQEYADISREKARIEEAKRQLLEHQHFVLRRENALHQVMQAQRTLQIAQARQEAESCALLQLGGGSAAAAGCEGASAQTEHERMLAAEGRRRAEEEKEKERQREEQRMQELLAAEEEERKKEYERQERELKLQVGIVLYFIDHRFAAPGLGWRHTAVVLEGIHPPRTTAGGGPSNPSKPFHDHNARRGP